MSSDTVTQAILETESVPNARIRGLVALFLRVGLGMYLLNAGLLGYVMESRNRGGPVFNPAFGRGGIPGETLQEFSKALPYFEIAAGVALIFGFLTTLAAVLSLILILVNPLLQTLYLVITPQQTFAMNPFSAGGEMTFLNSTRGVNLLLGAIVLWLSPRATNPYSIDALMFQPSLAPNPQESALVQPRVSAGPYSYVAPGIQEEIEVTPIDEPLHTPKTD